MELLWPAVKSWLSMKEFGVRITEIIGYDAKRTVNHAVASTCRIRTIAVVNSAAIVSVHDCRYRCHVGCGALHEESSSTRKCGLKLGDKKKPVTLQVIARQTLGRHSSVTVVRAGDKALILGVTENQISLLTEMNEVDLVGINDYLEPQGTGASLANGSPLPSPTRTGLLEQIRERTVRKV